MSGPPPPVLPAKTRVPSVAALERPRLATLIDAAWDQPLTLVVAPAGSGKTTLLAGFARAAAGGDRQVAWYQAGSAEADTSAFLAHLCETLRQAMPGLESGWDSPAGAAQALESAGGGAVALVIDDVHTLAGTAAEEALADLVSYLPDGVHVVLSGRRPPGFDLSRWRLAGQLVEIGPDDLRFRTWEVEELFVDHYHQRLRPEDLAVLARRTDGWAAGLALFHLATRNKTPAERRRVLGSLSSRQRDTRDYLTRNVLAELDEDRRDFLVNTSVLGRLSGPWCDALLDRTDSASVLDDLVERHLFLVSDDDGATYRQHEVLRSYLEDLLVQRLGEAGVRDLYAKAGPILEDGGALAEALRAYCRAQDWAAADRLLGHAGDRVFDAAGTWVGPLPAALADHDAWLLLADARRQVRSGHWPAALASYRLAEDAAVGSLLASTCREERFRLAGWLDPTSAAPTTATALLRRAIERDPGGIARELHAAAGAAGAHPQITGEPKLAAGFAHLLVGDVREAATTLSAAAENLDGDSVLGRWGAFVAAVLHHLLGEADGDLPASLAALEDVVPPWLGRLLRQLTTEPAPDLDERFAAASSDAADTENPWIALALVLARAVVQSLDGDLDAAVAGYDEAVEQAHALRAPVIGAWAASGAALVCAAFDPAGAAGRAEAAHRGARSVGCGGAAEVATLVSAHLGGEASWEEATRSLEAEGGGYLGAAVANLLGRAAQAATRPEPSAGEAATASEPGAAGEPAAGDGLAEAADGPGDGAAPDGESGGEATANGATGNGVEPGLRVEVRCLGPFTLTVNGEDVDVSGAQPRLRALLHRLALDLGRPVHRDQLRAALWPDDDTRTGTRNLQVAVSALRQHLEAVGGPGTGAALARRGDAYLLECGGGHGDLGAFEAAVEEGRRARREGRDAEAADALRRALSLYRGELLPDEGTSEWVLEERDRFRLLAVGAATLLAESLLADGDVAGTVEVAERGLGIDRYDDRLWRLVIEAHERSGNLAAAARAGQQYASVLDELGLTAGSD